MVSSDHTANNGAPADYCGPRVYQIDSVLTSAGDVADLSLWSFDGIDSFSVLSTLDPNKFGIYEVNFKASLADYYSKPEESFSFFFEIIPKCTDSLIQAVGTTPTFNVAAQGSSQTFT